MIDEATHFFTIGASRPGAYAEEGPAYRPGFDVHSGGLASQPKATHGAWVLRRRIHVRGVSGQAVPEARPLPQHHRSDDGTGI